MNVALWIAQGLLAAMFLMAGIMKLSKPKSELREKVGDWVDSVSDSGLKLIGLVEFLGAIGLVLPMVLDIVPILSPIAGIGLAVTMLGAMGLHIKRKEFNKLGMNVVLLAMAAFVAIGRLILVPVI